MNNLKYLGLIGLVALAILAYACQSSTQNRGAQAGLNDSETSEDQYIASSIKEPFQQFRKAGTTIKVMNNKMEAVTKELPSGTVLHIPAATFVYEDQQQVEGEVEVTLTEYHDVADLLMSGIPMHYDSAGERHILQTAGMVKISANKDGIPVMIAEGKEIQIDLASLEGKGDYNLYELDPKQGNWSYQNTASATPMATEENNPDNDSISKLSSRIQSIEANIASMTQKAPVKPAKLDNSMAPFDFVKDNGKFLELKDYKGITWQYAGISNERFLDANKSQAIFGEIWDDMSLSKYKQKGIYILTLKNKRKQIEFLVEPALDGKAYEKALKDFKKREAAYKAKVKAQQEELVKVKAEQIRRKRRLERFRRTFRIAKLGIYNWDRIMKMKQQTTVLAANFNYEGLEEPVNSKDIETYLVMPNDKSVINLKNWRKGFRYSAAVPNMLISILPGDKIYVYKKAAFKKDKPEGEFDFTLVNSGVVMNSEEDLREILAM
ncbi:MAG: hypothetical protein AAFY71_18885 [Bacteroidota bacterium]